VSYAVEALRLVSHRGRYDGLEEHEIAEFISALSSPESPSHTPDHAIMECARLPEFVDARTNR
jgi:hypothetical protein